VRGRPYYSIHTEWRSGGIAWHIYNIEFWGLLKSCTIPVSLESACIMNHWENMKSIADSGIHSHQSIVPWGVSVSEAPNRLVYCFLRIFSLLQCVSLSPKLQFLTPALYIRTDPSNVRNTGSCLVWLSVLSNIIPCILTAQPQKKFFLVLNAPNWSYGPYWDCSYASKY